MKILWSIVLVAAFMATPGAVQAQSGSGDGFNYTINPDNTNTIALTKYTGSASIVTIPTNINGLTVTSIGENYDYVFNGALTGVMIPASVTSISGDAFGGSSLTSVAIPSSVTNIGDAAFIYCYNLTAFAVDTNNSFYSSLNGVLLDKSQTTLIQYPLGQVGSYTVPGSVTSIGDLAFEYCTNLTAVAIPDSVTNIGPYAFQNCLRLTNLNLGNGVISIGDQAFNSCERLTSVTIPSNVTNFGEAVFAACSSLRTVAISDGVTAIGPVGFETDSQMNNLTIPASVTNIGGGAFELCSGLSNVFFIGNAPTVGSDAFYEANSTAYYLPGTTGWAEFATNAGIQAVLWDPLIQTADGSFGVSNNQFGFNITNGGTNNIPIVVEACTNLSNPDWTPLQSLTLTNGSYYFSDSQWTNYPGRFYRIRSP